MEYWFVTKILILNEWCRVWEETERLFLESKYKQCTELKRLQAIWRKNYIKLMYFLIANYLCTYLKKSSLNTYLIKMIAVENLYFFRFYRLKLHLGYLSSVG